MVRDRAGEELVRRGVASVAHLEQVLKRSRLPEVRCAAIFLLYRIGSSQARKAIRAALDDPDAEVRVAAARVSGMAKDRDALPRLMDLVRKDAPPVRRQAATAMEQIGDPAAAEALLSAAADPQDRFVEHATIHALISLKAATQAIEALKNPSPPVRKAALIALDQMGGRPLQLEHLLSILQDEGAALRHAALWVSSHHPEWSGRLFGSLSRRLLQLSHDRKRRRETRARSHLHWRHPFEARSSGGNHFPQRQLPSRISALSSTDSERNLRRRHSPEDGRGHCPVTRPRLLNPYSTGGNCFYGTFLGFDHA